MIKGKTLRHTLDKFLKNSEVAKEARVQVCLPNGEFYDITGIQLMENKLKKEAFNKKWREQRMARILKKKKTNKTKIKLKFHLIKNI